MSLAKDAETGQRGYLITGETSYLEPYNIALANIDKQVKTLEQLTADNPAQQARIPALKNRIADRLKILQEGLALRKENGFEAAREMILTGRGKDEMDELRRQIDEMVQSSEATARGGLATLGPCIQCRGLKQPNCRSFCPGHGCSIYFPVSSLLAFPRHSRSRDP